MKKALIIIFIIFTSSLNAETIDELLAKALKYEKENNNIEAMKIYKKIALEQIKINRIYIDEEKHKSDKAIVSTLNKIEDKETKQTIEQIFASTFNLYPYYENYFLPISYDIKKRDKRKQSEVKFQISVKKPIFYNIFKINETINLGYTQTSWWQLYDDSAPFRETNYRPEIFVDIPYGKEDTVLKSFKLGFLHESNGQNEPKSRSWNRLYLTTFFAIGNLFIVPKVWYRIPERNSDDDNPDIQKYLGYGDITLAYPYKKHTFKLLIRNNLRLNKENKGYAQFDWTFPFFNSKNTFGYIQASTGYGDSLIDYDKEVNRIGFGISLSR